LNNPVLTSINNVARYSEGKELSVEIICV